MYILIFKGNLLEYTVHPYFFLRKMIENKDPIFNNLKEFQTDTSKIVEFVFTDRKKNKSGLQNVNFNNYFFELPVLDQISGKELFDIFEKYKNYNFEMISYSSIGFHQTRVPMDDFNVFDIQERLLDDVHEDLKTDIIDVSWGNSFAILQKIDNPPTELVITENGEILY